MLLLHLAYVLFVILGLLLVLIGIAMVVYAGPLYEFSQAAAQQLVHPDAYVNAVLQAGGRVMTR